MDFSTPPIMTGAPHNFKAEQPANEDQQMSEGISQNSAAIMLSEFSGPVGRGLSLKPATLEETIRSIKRFGTDQAMSTGMFDQAILALGKIDTGNIVRGKRGGRGRHGARVNRQSTVFTMGEGQQDGELERGQRPRVRQAREERRSRDEKRQWAKEKQAKEVAFAMENAMENMSFDANATISEPIKAKPVEKVSFTPMSSAAIH
jgi:hypothetical protein